MCARARGERPGRCRDPQALERERESERERDWRREREGEREREREGGGVALPLAVRKKEKEQEEEVSQKQELRKALAGSSQSDILKQVGELDSLLEARALPRASCEVICWSCEPGRSSKFAERCDRAGSFPRLK